MRCHIQQYETVAAPERHHLTSKGAQMAFVPFFRRFLLTYLTSYFCIFALSSNIMAARSRVADVA